MNAYECYCDYLALKRHFSVDSFDYMKYGGIVRTSVDAYNKRTDKYYFERLAKNTECHNILLAHLSDNPELWIAEIKSDNKVFLEWKRRTYSMEYNFLEEIKNIEFPDDFKTSGEHPRLLKKYLKKVVSKETMVILNSVICFAPNWNKVITDDLIWPKINFNLKKYSPFLKYDKAKYKAIIDSMIQEQTKTSQ